MLKWKFVSSRLLCYSSGKNRKTTQLRAAAVAAAGVALALVSEPLDFLVAYLLVVVLRLVGVVLLARLASRGEEVGRGRGGTT